MLEEMYDKVELKCEKMVLSIDSIKTILFERMGIVMNPSDTDGDYIRIETDRKSIDIIHLLDRRIIGEVSYKHINNTLYVKYK
jgi:hypothetical protein